MAKVEAFSEAMDILEVMTNDVPGPSTLNVDTLHDAIHIECQLYSLTLIGLKGLKMFDQDEFKKLAKMTRDLQMEALRLRIESVTSDSDINKNYMILSMHVMVRLMAMKNGQTLLYIDGDNLPVYKNLKIRMNVKSIEDLRRTLEERNRQQYNIDDTYNIPA